MTRTFVLLTGDVEDEKCILAYPALYDQNLTVGDGIEVASFGAGCGYAINAVVVWRAVQRTLPRPQIGCQETPRRPHFLETFTHWGNSIDRGILCKGYDSDALCRHMS
jgi:hypothetical protein